MGQATVTVSGKLAQFGSRLLVPVSDAMLAQFADNFRAAAAAVPVAAASVAPEALASPTGAAATPAVGDQPTAPSPAAAVPIPAAAAPVKELNALSLMWTVFKSWLGGLFGRKS